MCLGLARSSLLSVSPLSLSFSLSLSLFLSLSLSLSPPSPSPSPSLSISCLCVCVCHISLPQVLKLNSGDLAQVQPAMKLLQEAYSIDAGVVQ